MGDVSSRYLLEIGASDTFHTASVSKWAANIGRMRGWENSAGLSAAAC